MPRKPKVLVADDSLTVRKMVEMLLSQEGYEVILAETGAKCLALCASSPPDLLLLDYVLPDMRGVEVCQNLMNSPSTWEIPVLLMSGNGNAIRQLYQDMNNVADYLTKPFPPNVLKAVVAHVRQKSRQGEAPVTSANLPTAMGSSAPSTSLRAGQEVGGRGSAQMRPGGGPPAAPSPRVAAKRQAPEEVVAKFRNVFRKHWRAAWQRVPDWEGKRGDEAPATFYEDRFLAEALWKDFSADLLSAAGWTTSFTNAFRCPTSLVRFDMVLKHLHAAKATGELRVELGEETISVFFSNGDVAFLGSNNPRQYCAGSTFGFHALPHGVIAQAVQAQELHGVPFFVSLHQNGCLSEASLLRKLLREQGERAVLRAYQASASVCDFRPLDKLPELVERYRRPFPVWHLLLVCYRKVDDWFTIEQTLPGFSAGLSPSLEFQSRVRQLHLNDQERQLLGAVTPSRSVQEIVDSCSLGPYLASQVLFRFLKLGLFFSVSRPEENLPESSAEESLAAQVSQPDAPPASVPAPPPDCPAARPESPAGQTVAQAEPPAGTQTEIRTSATAKAEKQTAAAVHVKKKLPVKIQPQAPDEPEAKSSAGPGSSRKSTQDPPPPPEKSSQTAKQNPPADDKGLVSMETALVTARKTQDPKKTARKSANPGQETETTEEAADPPADKAGSKAA